ncbi:hypothetical protein [Oceaniglobus trochenteri]|uniref:hypothetical protein n=1 Tax=Oceaniglobus trochenteri TaxID=2763260 RepID=UPI001D000719|nr:hypothetical protein [Oceaniglobus trochenteri]
MSIALFLKRVAMIFAAFAFAALFKAVLAADEALLANGLLALLPSAIVVILLVRIARRPARLAD